MDRLYAAQLSWKIYGDPDGTTNGKVTPGYIWDTCPSIAECLDSSQSSHNVMSSSFISVAQNGTLPNFSLVVPAGVTPNGSPGPLSRSAVRDDDLFRAGRPPVIVGDRFEGERASE